MLINDWRLFEIIQIRLADLMDIFFVSVVFYYLFLLFRGTRAVQMFFGCAFLIILWMVASWWGLHGVTWLFSNLATVGLVALVIIFQPEMRGALTRIGQMISQADLRKVFFHTSGMDKVLSEIITAVQDLARNNYGALIVIEKRVGLRNFMDTGEHLEARVSSQLLRTIFFPNTPLHDGAVIIRRDRVAAAGCILPLPVGAEQDSGMGMRHRAARALASESDALVITVSEETGFISVAYRNTFRRKLTIKELEGEIKRHLDELKQT